MNEKTWRNWLEQLLPEQLEHLDTLTALGFTTKCVLKLIWGVLLLFKWQKLEKNTSTVLLLRRMWVFLQTVVRFPGILQSCLLWLQGMGSKTELLLWSTGFNEGFLILKGGLTAAFPDPGHGLSASFWCCESFTWDSLKLFLQHCFFLVWKRWKIDVFSTRLCNKVSGWSRDAQYIPKHPWIGWWVVFQVAVWATRKI